MINIIERKGMISVFFESILDLIDYMPKRNANYFKNQIGTSKIRSGKLGPTNSCGKDVLNHSLLGDETLYNNYLKNKVIELDKATGYYTTDYKQTIKVVKRKVKYTDFGDEIDIHKVYRGESGIAWRKTERVEVDIKHHLVTILVDIGGSWDEEVKDTLWRASIVVKLVRDLEQAGKSVKVIIGNVTRQVTISGKDVSTSMIVKQYNVSLPLERLAAMCNLGFRRSLGFAMTYCVEERLHSGLGQPTHITHNLMPWQLKDEEDAGHTKFVIVGRASSKRSAISELKNCYKQMKEFLGE